jgi:hypothetical protein
MRVHPPSHPGRLMDPNARIAQELLLEHRHNDGSWSRMERVEHDSADHDAERSWLRRMIFRCTTCDEEVSVVAEDVDENGAPGPR